MNIKKTVLPNGLRLVAVPIEGLESATVVVLTGVGSRYENKEKLGISHVLEHMAFKGTKKRPKPLDIASLVEGVGAEWNAYTWKELTGYWIKLAGGHIDLAIEVLSDILLNPILDEKEITKEVGVIFEEMKMRKDSPRIRINDMIDEQVLGDQPVGWDTIGTEKSLRSIRRSDLARFIATYYRPENMVVTVAGKLPTDIESRIFEAFKSLPKGVTPGYQAAVMEQSKPRVRLETKKTEQAHLAIGVEGVSHSDIDFYPLALLTTILGEGMSSRLWESVREKRGLAYTVRSEAYSFHDTGVFFVYAGVGLDKVDPATETILKELSKTTETKVSAKELKKAKEYLIGRLKLSLEDTQGVADNFGWRELLEKKQLSVEEIITLVKRVTDDDIFRVAKRIFRTEKLNLSLIGPFEDKSRFLKLLKV